MASREHRGVPVVTTLKPLRDRPETMGRFYRELRSCCLARGAHWNLGINVNVMSLLNNIEPFVCITSYVTPVAWLITMKTYYF